MSNNQNNNLAGKEKVSPKENISPLENLSGQGKSFSKEDLIAQSQKQFSPTQDFSQDDSLELKRIDNFEKKNFGGATILAIESTGKTAGIAIADGKKILGSINLNSGYTHSQTLLPMIDNLLGELDMNSDQIEYVACSSGPGSFTGIKIGVATAKAFAHALDIPIIDVPTLDAMALNIFAPDKIIIPIMDARRNQIYGAIYRYTEKTNLERLTEYLNCDIDEIIEQGNKLKKDNEQVIYLGDATEVYKEKIMETDNIIVPEHLQLQRAESVIEYAKKILSQNESIPATEPQSSNKNIFKYSEFIPFYLRKAQAENETN